MYRYSQSPSLLSLVVIVQDPSRSFPWFISCTFSIVHSYIEKSNGFSCNKVHGSQYCGSRHMCCVLHGENVLNCWQMEKKKKMLCIFICEVTIFHILEIIFFRKEVTDTFKHCCDQVILQPCKMNYVKPQILYSIFLHAKQRILQAPKFHWKF